MGRKADAKENLKIKVRIYETFRTQKKAVGMFEKVKEPPTKAYNN